MLNFHTAVQTGLDKAQSEKAAQSEIVEIFSEAEKAISDYCSDSVYLYLGSKFDDLYYKADYDQLFLSSSPRQYSLILSETPPIQKMKGLMSSMSVTANAAMGSQDSITQVGKVSIPQGGYPVSVVIGRDTFVCEDKITLISQMQSLLESEKFGRELLYKIEKVSKD